MISERLHEILQQISRAASRSGRNENSVSLLAVSKTVGYEQLIDAITAGQICFGENYLQEAQKKDAALRSAIGSQSSHTFQLIGPLQRNKAKDAVGFFSLIHTLDRQSLADALAAAAKAKGCVQRVLIQVNVSGEVTKSGVQPDDAIKLARYARDLGSLQLDGLMCIGSMLVEENIARSRKEFRMLADLRAVMERELSLPLPELSMGMSSDFELAIEEGATIVRVGSALFGERPVKG